MHIIIDKTTKSVIWNNTDSRELTAVQAYANFDSEIHEHYKINHSLGIGEIFEPELYTISGILAVFNPITIYNRETGEAQVIRVYSERNFDSEVYTTDPPEE